MEQKLSVIKNEQIIFQNEMFSLSLCKKKKKIMTT